MIKREYLGQTITKNGVSVKVSEANIKVLRMLGINYVFEAPKRDKMSFPKIERVEEKKPIEKMRKDELKTEAKKAGIEGYEEMTKSELIDALL